MRRRELLAAAAGAAALAGCTSTAERTGAATNGTKVGDSTVERWVDCEAGVVVYTRGHAAAGVDAVPIGETRLEYGEECP